MNVMLTVIFVCIALGLVAPQFNRRVQVAIGLVAAVMTALYYFRGDRFI